MTYSGLFYVTDWAPTILGGVLGLETPAQIANASGGGMNLWEALLGVTAFVPIQRSLEDLFLDLTSKEIT